MNELILQIITSLNKTLSKRQIETDIKSLEKTPFYIRLIGRLNKSLTRGQIQTDIRSIQNEINNNPIEVNAEVNQNSLQRSFNEARANLERNIQNNPVEIDVNANVNTEEIVQAQQQIGQHTNRILGDYITANQIFQAVIQSIKIATQEIEKLNKAEIDLQMITQNSAEKIKSLMRDYNSLAVEMGATTLQVTSGASEWLRQGKSVAETNELIRDSMILSKISQMESSEATRHLTSAMNGFKLETSEVIGIVDKLNAVDLASASDAAGLAESLSRCANSADVAGISVDKLIGYIATVSEVTQKSASSVGEGFKSITARLQNIKANKFIDENGIDISGEINDAEKILGKFNIALRNNAKEFRDAQDVIDDVAKSWHNMSTVEQSAIASAFGTVHQRENVIALFENYGRALELAEVSANSAGAAMEKFAVYENSLEAATNRLTASLQGIAYNTIDSNFLKNLANGTAHIIELIDKTQLLKTGLTAGIFTGALTGLTALGTRMVAVRNNVAQFTQAMNISRQATALNANQLTQIIGNIQGLSQAQLRLIVSSRQLTNEQRIQIVSATGLNRAEAEAQLQTWGLVNAENGATAATFSLRGAWEGLKASIVSNPIGLIVAGLTAAVTVYSSVKQKQEELIEQASEAIDKYNEQSQALDDLKQKYIDICNSEDSTSKKTEELNEWKKTLIETYGLEKDAIEQVNLAREDGLKLLDDEIIKNKINGAETWLTENKQAYEDAKKKLLSANNSAETSVIPQSNIVMNIEKGALDDYSENFDDILKQLTIKNPTKNNPLAQIKIQGSNVLQQYENLSKILNDITSIEITKGLNKSEQELYDALLKKQAEYKKVVTDDMRDIVENGKKYTDMIKLYNFQTDDGINFENVSADTYKEFRDKFLESLGYGYKKDSEDFSLDVEKILLDMLPDLENAYRGIEISDIVDTSNADEIKENINNVAESIEDLEKSYDELSKSADNFTKSQKTLTNALKEQKEHGQLSADTIKSLSEAGYSQALAVDKETGAVTLNMEAYNRLNEQKKLKIKLDIEQQNTELETKLKEEESAISSLKSEYEALAKANKEANSERLKAIEIELAQHSQNKAKLQDLVDKNNFVSVSLDAPTFDNSSTKTDTWKEEAEEKIANIKHLYEMEQITYASYLSQLDKLNEKYFANDKKYLDDFRKYEEEIYKGRKKLNEDLIAEEEKQQKAYHDKRISELETQITVTTKNSVDDQGNKLTASEKFDYIRASYSDIIAELERRINEIISSGIEGHEDEVKQLEKQIEEYSDKLQDTFKDEIDYEIDYIKSLQDKYNDYIDERINRHKEEKETIEDKYDAEIKSIDDTIDALKDQNDATSKSIELKKAEQDFENAKQRTRMVYGADGRITYEQDTDKIAEAQQKADDLKLDMLIDNLEKQKKAKEDEKDAALEKYDVMIKDLEAQKESQDNFFDKTLDRLDNSVNSKPTEGLDRVIDQTYTDPKEANEVKQGLKDVENAVKDGTEQAKDNFNEVNKNSNMTDSVKTGDNVTSTNSKTPTTMSNSDKSAFKTDNVKQGDTSANQKIADNKTDASNKQVAVYGEQVAVYDKDGENKQVEQTSNYDSFMKLLYNMAGKEPDGYERYKRGEYDEGHKFMRNIFSDDVFMGRAMKPYEDAIDSFNETVDKLNAIKVNQQPVNVTTGDIVIQNPVGDTKQLAQEIKNELHKEALMAIPNDAMKIIYRK